MLTIERAVQDFFSAYSEYSDATGIRLTDSQQYWAFVRKLDSYNRQKFFCFHQYPLRASEKNPAARICTRCKAVVGRACAASPDGIHHYYRKGSVVRLLNGEFLVPEQKRVVGRCIFCDKKNEKETSSETDHS